MYHGPGVDATPRGDRTVANGKLLRQLIRCQKQHHLLANDLERILYGNPRTPTSPALRKLTTGVPEDRERGLPLLEVREPARGWDDIVLSPANRSLIEGFCANTTAQRSARPAAQ